MKYNYSVIGNDEIPKEMLVIMNIFSKSISKTHKLSININTPLEASAFYGSNDNNIVYSPWSGFYSGISLNKENILKKDEEILLEKLAISREEVYSLNKMERDILFSKLYALTNNESPVPFVIHYKGDKNENSHLFKLISDLKIESFDLSDKKCLKRILTMMKKKKINLILESEKILKDWKSNPPIGIVSSFKNGFVTLNDIEDIINKH